MGLSDRPVALITGATKNTGFACAMRFAREGYDVCVTSRSGQAAEAAAGRVVAAHPGVQALGLGMRTDSAEDIRAAFARVRDRFGRLDALVCNATDPGYDQSILSTTPEAYDTVMACNARGYFFCTQEAARLMIRGGRGGAICLVGSVHSKAAIPKRICYAASKGAIDVLCRNAAYELGKHGIRVNLLVAGAIRNERYDAQTEAQKAERARNWPLGIVSEPEDAANAVYFLCSNQARTITGCELTMDSGARVPMLAYDRHWDE